MKNKAFVVLVIVLLIGMFILLGARETSDSKEVTNDSVSEEVVEEVEGVVEGSEEVMGSMDEEVAEVSDEPEVVEGADAPEEVIAETESSVKEFTLDSFNFGYSMEEIRVNKGDEVTINLTNSDGFHDWVLDEFGAATLKIPAGQTTSVTFTADEIGEYEYYCSVGSHRANGMVGKLIVE